MESVAAFGMLLHPVEEWLCSVEGHGERCLDQPVLWNGEFLHRVRELAGGGVDIVDHMAHNGVHAHGVLGHERGDTRVRYVAWSRLFEKSICDGELYDSSGTMFIHTARLGNLREGGGATQLRRFWRKLGGRPSEGDTSLSTLTIGSVWGRLTRCWS